MIINFLGKWLDFIVTYRKCLCKEPTILNNGFMVHILFRLCIFCIITIYEYEYSTSSLSSSVFSSIHNSPFSRII